VLIGGPLDDAQLHFRSISVHMILVDAQSRHAWLMGAVEKGLREELAELQVEVNEEKSRIVDLARGDSFGLTSVASGVNGAYGVPTARQSSRNERGCYGSSRKCSAATDRNQ
jgi:hypothetical protein